MRVLVITGDQSFKKGHPRFDVQANAVDELVSVYWGSSSLFPKLPKGSFDVVSSQDPFWRGVFGYFAAKKYNATFNVQLHADLEAQTFLKRLIARFVLKRADSIRVVSEKLKKQIEGGGVVAPITVLPVFLPLERFQQVVRVPEENPIVLWVGRFENEKDPLHAVSVFKNILKEVPGAKLIMLGSGALEETLRQAARGLPVEFPGWQDTVPYLTRASVVLSTSCTESWGASIIEALAAGVPVVAPDVGVAEEAGAFVVLREKLAEKVIEVIKNGTPATLHLNLLSETEWITTWKRTLT